MRFKTMDIQADRTCEVVSDVDRDSGVITVVSMSSWRTRFDGFSGQMRTVECAGFDCKMGKIYERVRMATKEGVEI